MTACCEHPATSHREIFKDFEPTPYIRSCLACPPHDREHQYQAADETVAADSIPGGPPMTATPSSEARQEAE